MGCRKWRTRAARRAALLPLATWPAVIGRRAVAGGGRVLRGGRLRCCWVTWPPVVGLRADAAGGRVLRDERAVRAFLGAGPWLPRADGAVRPIGLTGSRGPVRKTGGPCLGTLPTDGAVWPVRRDRFTRTRWGRRRTGPDTLPAGGRSGWSDWTGSRGPLWATGGSGKP